MRLQAAHARPSSKRKSLRFIDLFAGLGGFHIALDTLGFEGVFASEIDPVLKELYERNFGLKPAGDIRGVRAHDIPRHDVLCAGFPCQPFSKAGSQLGLDCPQWGDLFRHVLKVIRHHHPSFVLLENVPHLERHDGGRTWARMRGSLEREGYEVISKRLSPHRFGIPQVRERLFIIASQEPLNRFEWPDDSHIDSVSITQVLDKAPADAKPIPEQAARCLEVWQEFLDQFPEERELPSFPIWSMEFGATYPYEEDTPHAVGARALRSYRGSHGIRLDSFAPAERFDRLPSYARVSEAKFPSWKINFIRSNRDLYAANKPWIKRWLPSILEFPPSLQKLEWNCKGEARDIWKYVLQFRASGVRVKRPTSAPSLVSMTTTQVPIVGWERRYMTPRECARLQSMGSLRYLPEAPTRAYKALGNAVNVELITMLVSRLMIATDRTPASSKNAR